MVSYATDMSNMNAAAVLGLNVIREFETKIKFGRQTTIELEPMFDTNDLVRYENFSREQSRFGPMLFICRQLYCKPAVKGRVNRFFENF